MSKFNRSPIELRSKIQNKATNSIKKPTMTMSKLEVSTKVEQNSYNKKEELAIFMNEIKNSMHDFQIKIQASIQNLHEEFNTKCKQLENEIKTIKGYSDYLNQNISLDSAIQPMWKHSVSDQTVDYLLKGSAIAQFKKDFLMQFETMRIKISKIEYKNQLTEKTVFDLVTTLATFMSTKTSRSNEHSDQVACEKIDDLKCSIECLQNEIDRIKTESLVDGEKLITLNRQMHILSAKYVDFNDKINKHLLQFNAKFNQPISRKEIIDSDTKPFIQKYYNNKNDAKFQHEPNFTSKQESDRNLISLRRKITNRFAVKYDPFAYTKSILVAIHDTKIYNLDRFKVEFTEQFEILLGNKNLISKLVINRYKMNSGVISSIMVTVLLQVPLNYKYIDDFELPQNWSFFHIQVSRKSKTKKREKTDNTKNRIKDSKYM